MKIATPGIYDLSMEVYHSDCCVGPSISSSGLRKIHLECPLEYWSFSYLNPNAYPEETKDVYSFGKAAHCLLVGGEVFEKHYAIRPREWKDWRKQEARDWKEAQLDQGKTVIIPSEYTAITLMARVLEKHPMTPTLLEGQIEKSLIWQDPETEVWLKARPDVIPAYDSVVVDYKTTVSVVRPFEIQREISKRGYFMQMALVEDGLRILADKTNLNMVLLFQMKKAPFHVAPFEISPEYLQIGRDLNRKALRTFADCLNKGEWPGYVEGIPVAHPPEWLVREWETTTTGEAA